MEIHNQFRELLEDDFLHLKRYSTTAGNFILEINTELYIEHIYYLKITCEVKLLKSILFLESRDDFLEASSTSPLDEIFTSVEIC